jgi:hypothetical protein
MKPLKAMCYPGWPWRWRPGDTCFARDTTGAFTTEVHIIERIDDMQLPHYIVEDIWGARYRMPQLCLSSTRLQRSALR